MPNSLTPSQIVNLSSGQIQFADPSKPWGPDDFPALPSTTLIITAVGTADTANISTLSFTNRITYEPYEPTAVYPSTLKSLLTDNRGIISYAEPRIGYLSTISPAFTTGYNPPVAINSFAPSSIGGAGILDVVSDKADTVTNAIGKLDAWIANAFLLQPPIIQPIEPETTSLYGGMRWLNFNTYNVLDKFVPYVTNILFIVGDPASSNYCTFEMSDCEYFPYKTFVNGISPSLYPLVRLRIFTDCFLTAADELYSKQVMQTHCVNIITEAGNVAFPESGKVFAIEKTNGVDTYTTVSVYFPNLPLSYPKNTQIPVYIVYMNKTDSAINVTQTSTIISGTGNPGPVRQVTPIGATPNSVTFQVQRPIYADATGLVTEPMFSSYQMSYTLKQMNTTYDTTTGFRYGIANPTTIPTTLTPYINNTLTQSFPYIQSTQQVVLTGISPSTIFPGTVWSTTTTATNCASLAGTSFSSVWVSTLFPVQQTPNISSIQLVNQNIPGGGLASATASTITYTSYNNGWNVGPFVSTDVLFFSVSTPLQCVMSTAAQFNDITLPGDRSTITVKTIYTNVDKNPIVGAQLTLSTFANDFPINQSIESDTDHTAALILAISDSQTLSTSTRYFYNYLMQGEQVISTISTANQTLQFTIQNTTNNNMALRAQTLSSLKYVFQTDQDSPFSTLNINFKGVTSTGQVSGMYTPSQSSQICFDMVGVNFANAFTASTLAHAQIGYIQQYTKAVVPAGPKNNYRQNVRIYSIPGEVTTLPFPQNTPLTMSSLCVSLYPNTYTNPVSTPTLFLAGAFIAASPLQTQSTFVSTFGSPFFIDTLSLSTVSSFTNTNAPYGQRVQNLLPRSDAPGTVNNMGDSVDTVGNSGQGLNVTVSSFFTMTYPNIFQVSSAVVYNNASSISSVYTSSYSRELLYTQGHYTHPAGYNFSQFSGKPIGQPNAVYPNFTNDLVNDVNDGYRYASFAYETPTLNTPTPYQFINIRIVKPSFVSTVGFISTINTFFPDAPVDPYVVPNMNVRIHAKYFGAYDVGSYQTMESEWINGLKECDQTIFNDQTFDIGGSYYASTIGNDIIYSIQMNRRFYTKVGYIIRVGISRLGSYAAVSTNAITFDGIRTWLTDDITNTQTDIIADIY